MTSIAIDRNDGLSSSTAIKGPCRVVATSTIALAGLLVIDGIQTAVDDRVLYAVAGINAGIWIVDTGSWRRAKDFSGNRDVRLGTQIYVTSGTIYSASGWYVNTANPIVIGTTSLTISQNVMLNAAQLIALEASATAAAAAASADADDADDARIAAEAARDAALAAVPNFYPATRTALKAANTSTITSAYLTESGREGQFIWTLGNYSTQIAADTLEGIYIKADAIAATVGAWVRVHEGYSRPQWHGGTNTAAMIAAANVMGSVLLSPDTTYTWEAQGTLDRSDVLFFSWPGLAKAYVYVSYVGTAIILGNGSTRRNRITFKNIEFYGVAGQVMFESRYVRGIYFDECKLTADQLIALGRAGDYVDDSNFRGTYIFQHSRCEMFHVASPTKHFIQVYNFAGQYEFYDSFVEGVYDVNYDGFNATSNVWIRIDHLILRGGYFSRFRHAYNFEDARVVNLHSTNHHSEGNNGNAFRFYVTTSTSKNIARVGWETIQIGPGKLDSLSDNTFLIRSERTSSGCTGLKIHDLHGQDLTKTYIMIWADVGLIRGVQIHTIRGLITPASATEDMVRVVGGASETITEIQIDQVSSYVSGGTALRSIVLLEGLLGNICTGSSLTSNNATVKLNNGATITNMSLAANKRIISAQTHTFGPIAANDIEAHDFTVTGARSGDSVNVVYNGDPGDMTVFGSVSANDTVRVKAHADPSGCTPGSRTYTITVEGTTT